MTGTPAGDGPLIVQSDRTLLLETDHPDAPACRAAIGPFAGKVPLLLWPYVSIDWMIPRMLAMQTARLASSRALAKAGSRMETRIAMIEITTSSSIRVKPVSRAS